MPPPGFRFKVLTVRAAPVPLMSRSPPWTLAVVIVPVLLARQVPFSIVRGVIVICSAVSREAPYSLAVDRLHATRALPPCPS